ncbi:MAG: anthranilate phosphoribosyltransferase, partial [Bacteroidia bacterium]|nr:anthranilate phosphoribosyltransferase [Bacteroidia bacterium]
SFVVAASGVPVAKHGNHGVSSIAGSSTVLQYLGCEFTADPSVLMRQVEACGICFLHAPLFHPAMKNVAPVRKDLGVKTFFNMLGPMVNPAFPKNQLVGVFSLELARLYNYLYQKTSKNFSIVHSLDGYDEISLTGPFKVFSRQEEQLMEPYQLGLSPVAPEDLFGGDTVAESARIFQKVLRGEGTSVQNDVVTANSALAIRCARPEKSLEECLDNARESLLSGRAWQTFEKFMNLQEG